MTVFQGIVTAVDGQGHPSVQIAPQVATPAVSGSSPATGDVVWLLVDGTSMTWLPAPQPASSTPPPPPPPPPPPTDGVYWGGTADLTDTSAWPDRVLMPAPLGLPSNAVQIPAGANIQSYVTSHPAGTSFILAAGTYDGGTSGYQVFPTQGQWFYGQGAGKTICNNVWFHRQDSSRSNVVIANMTIKGCVSQSGPFGAHLAAIDSNFHESNAAGGWAVYNCEITGNYMGISAGPGSRISNNTIHHNPGKGMAGGMSGTIVSNNQFYANMMPGSPGWYDTGGDDSGVKFTVMTGATFTGNLFHKANPNGVQYGGIGGCGVWMDVACGLGGDRVSASPSTGNTFSGNLIYSNYGSGVCDETGGNNTWTGNLIAGNGRGAKLDPWRAAGLVVQSSNHDAATGNYVWGNGPASAPASITVYMDQSGNDRSDARRSQNNTVTGNFCDVAPGQLTGTWSGGAGGNTIANNTVVGGLAGVTIPRVKAGPQALA
ncbi:right-handed parallel beta-helix repeat-containing protein [Frankia sp. AgW1.1]|uniref:right-handed parallel beta-helix repeat-containing protein n=1 Tax=Frankia sp. AgW1.1 TaxID=1836971 RepID=UPI0019340ED1|nr:right-handed parallel beta-helix repeat-containing protein [Frankia sp. AgW1.1]MBL7487071.1 right-handed parallel beta-helix repeat-containing protein [Frankia sp. AgW1.1]